MALLEEPIKEALLIKNFIAGEWVESKGEIKDVVNPATGKMIAKVPISTKDEIDAAVKADQEAFPDWRRTTPLARSRILFRFKELLEENFEELSRIQTQEHGTTIDESTHRPIEVVFGFSSISRVNFFNLSIGETTTNPFNLHRERLNHTYKNNCLYATSSGNSSDMR